jgi:hypothetical protein
MANRLDALSVRESNEKSYFTKIGAAFENKDGKGWTVLLDAMPAPTDGQFKIMLREPLPKDDRQRSAEGDRQQARSNSGGSGGWAKGDALDDEIPF